MKKQANAFYRILLFLAILIALVYSGPAQNRPTEPVRCCFTDEMVGEGFTYYNGVLKLEFKFYTDYHRNLVLEVEEEETRLNEGDTKTVYTFRNGTCTKSVLENPTIQCPLAKEGGQNATFIDSYDKDTRNGLGEHLIDEWTFTEDSTQGKQVHRVFVNPETCQTELRVVDIFNGSLIVEVYYPNQTDHVEDMTIFDKDTSDCVWKDRSDLSM